MKVRVEKEVEDLGGGGYRGLRINGFNWMTTVLCRKEEG